ncbi:glycoside hydrolase family 15 protein [Streptomyces sp. NPDC045431]|uniref:glycoside hydrolase family 15 protein n=1 Tax=Streptomyces sp. NPDC045431 TaxID=3155613 RepID=UPI0033ED96D3
MWEPSDLQPLHGLAGQRRLTEASAPWLSGYEGSCPARFGNAAVGRLQLDVYGEVLNTVYSALRAGVPIDAQVWHLVASFMDHLERHWQEPDAGLWEVRGSAERWRALRQEIRKDVLRRGWDDEQGSFVQYYGSRRVDAASLLLPRLGFLPPPTTSGCGGPWRRRAPWSTTASCAGTPRRTATCTRWTGCAAARAPSSPAPSGTPTPSP